MKNTEPPRSSSRPRWKQWLIENFDLYSRNHTELLDDLQRANNKNILHEDVVEMIQGVLEFDVLQVRDIMIPRSRINFIYYDDDFATILSRIAETEHSRYPVFDEDRDDLIGILLAKDLLKYIGRQDEFAIDDIIRPALLVPESQRLNRLLTEFRNNRSHMAMVIDEYAGVAGLVTFEDVLEQIVGDIDDEHDDEDEDEGLIKPLNQGRYLVDAGLSIEDFNAAFKTDFSDEDFDTIAGLVINELGKIPQQGETVDLQGLQLTVTRSDGRRIVELEVQPSTPVEV